MLTKRAAIIVSAIIFTSAAATAAPPDERTVDQCRRRADSCVWITGKLIPPGSNETPTPTMCRRIDPETGDWGTSWPVSEKIHIFWNENFLESGWFDSCDRSWWPFE